jgi:hypothetical protein
MHLGLQGLTNLYPLVSLLALLPLPQAAFFIKTEYNDFSSQLGSSRRYDDRRDLFDLLCHTGLLRLRLPRTSPPLRFAPPRLDHLPHDRAALLGRRTSPACGLGLPGRRLAAATAERNCGRILSLRHAWDSSIRARRYVPVALHSPLHVLLERRCSHHVVQDLPDAERPGPGGPSCLGARRRPRPSCGPRPTRPPRAVPPRAFPRRRPGPWKSGGPPRQHSEFRGLTLGSTARVRRPGKRIDG